MRVNKLLLLLVCFSSRLGIFARFSGRDVFYNAENSVVVSPTVESVTEGHNQMKKLLQTVDRESIRRRVVEQMVDFRATLGRTMQSWFDSAGVVENATAVLEQALHSGRYAETFLNAWSADRLVKNITKSV